MTFFILNTDNCIYRGNELSNNELVLVPLLKKNAISLTFANIYFILDNDKIIHIYNSYTNKITEHILVPFQTSLIKLFVGYDNSLQSRLYYLDNKNNVYSVKLDYYNMPSTKYDYEVTFDKNINIIEIFQREGIWYIIYDTPEKYTFLNIYLNDFTLIDKKQLYNNIKIRSVHLQGEYLHILTTDNEYILYNLILNSEKTIIYKGDNNIKSFGKYITDTKLYTIWNNNKEGFIITNNKTSSLLNDITEISVKDIFEIPQNIQIINTYYSNNSTFNIEEYYKPFVWGLPKQYFENIWKHIDIDNNYITINSKNIDQVYPIKENRNVTLYSFPFKKIIDSIIYGYKNFKIMENTSYGWSLYDSILSKIKTLKSQHESQKIIEIDSIYEENSYESTNTFLYIHPINKHTHFLPVRNNMIRVCCNDEKTDLWIAYIAKKEYKVTRLYFNIQV